MANHNCDRTSLNNAEEIQFFGGLHQTNLWTVVSKEQKTTFLMEKLKGALGFQEITDKKTELLRAMSAEFLGTLFLNFFGCGSIMTQNIVAISFAFGIIVAGSVQIIGHVSGGHINPAVTFGMMIIGKVPIIRALLYVLSQCVGAIAGSTILKCLSEKAKFYPGAVQLSDATPVQGLGVESFLGLLLVMVICSVTDEANPESKGLGPLFIGLTVTVCHIIAVDRTGSGMNPARALGSAVSTGIYTNHWVYWIGPILGGIIGALIYTYIFSTSTPKQEELP